MATANESAAAVAAAITTVTAAAAAATLTLQVHYRQLMLKRGLNETLSGLHIRATRAPL